MDPRCCKPSFCTPNCNAVLDPFCISKPQRQIECYFNPFLHGQCLGVDLNAEGLRREIQQCQEEYKRKVWAVLKKYAVGDNAGKTGGGGGGNNQKNQKNQKNANNSQRYTDEEEDKEDHTDQSN